MAGREPGRHQVKRRRGISFEGEGRATVIPDKLFFRIGEASRLTGVRPYVLRYWESEFSILKPEKSRTGQRLYRREDLLTILRIKELLYQRGYTIAGAKQYLLLERQAADPKSTADLLMKIKEGLLSISAVLAK